MTLSAMRLRGMLTKEVLQILRDPSSIALALVMPLVLLFLFGYGVNLDAENIPVAIVTDDHGGAARDLVGRFELSRQFQVRRAADIREAESLMQQRAVDAIVRLRNDVSAGQLKAAEPQPPVQVIINGIDGNRARLIEGYVRRITGSWAAQRRERGEEVSSGPVSTAQRIWFNEGAVSRNFLVPGLITLIMTLIGILLTALAVLGSLFMLASLGFGLMLSAAVRVQFVAAQISIVAGFLPAFFLSGLIFDLESTPKAIQIISHAVPARYFVTISHTLFMAGDIWSVLLPNGLVLAGMAIVFLGLAFRKISKRLEG